jgi:type III secretion system FlhB-like substrate exporter
MLAYPMNAPVLVGRGDNTPTQNVINRLGGFWQLDVPPGGDVNKAVGFMKMPEIPADAWRMMDLIRTSSEATSGANSQMQQGNLGGPGSSAARTATGASRIAQQSDQSIADPVDSVAEGVIVPVIEFLIKMVKERMPLREIRELLSDKHAAVIERAIDEDQFIDAEFEVAVLAGQKLAAKQGIQQLIPLFLQILQQPQLLDYLHQRGDTVAFDVILDLMMQVSELQQQPDIFRALTDAEKQHIQQMNPGAQKVQSAAAIEQLKGKNKQDEIHAKGEVDLANKAADIAMTHISEGIPLTRAMGLVERSDDVSALKNGLPDATQ